MPSNQVHVGDIVMSADGKDLGTVKELGDTCFRIAAKRRRDYWLANNAVEGRDAGIAVLYFESNRLGDATVDVDLHSGQHSHPKPPSEGGGAGLLKPLLIMAGIGAVALRDPDRRKKAMEVARKGTSQVKSKLNKARDSGISDEHDYGATSTFGMRSESPARVVDPSPGPPPRAFGMPPGQSGEPTTARQPSPREEAVVREVTLAFPTMNLRVMPVSVHNLEGGETETLRFTLDETASSDLELGRLEGSAVPEGTLADELIRDLRTQLPPEAGQPES